MKKICFVFFSYFIFLLGLTDLAGAQVYTPILILNGSQLESVSSDDFAKSSSNTGFGVGGIVEKAFSEKFDWRFGAAFVRRKFYLMPPSGTNRRGVALSSLDVPVSILFHLDPLISVFGGVVGSYILDRKCLGAAPCPESGGEDLIAHMQIGLSFGGETIRFEPYFEQAPFSIIENGKNLKTYGLNIHLFRDGDRKGQF